MCKKVNNRRITALSSVTDDDDYNQLSKTHYLLTANHTTEKKELQTSYENLTKEKEQLERERDQLQISYKSLTEERDQSQTHYITITGERDQLQMHHNSMIRERDQLQRKISEQEKKISEELGEYQFHDNNCGFELIVTC